jgi:K+-transporting ATPase KdpF subunit
VIVAGLRGDDLSGLVISVLLAAYLVYALIRPERM